MAVARVTKEEKNYLIIYRDGSRERVTIPAGSRVTYGKIVPAGTSNSPYTQGGEGAYAIRVYEGGEGIQLGIFPDVKSFRDLGSLKVEKLRHNDQGEPGWMPDDGSDITDDVAKALGADHSKSGR